MKYHHLVLFCSALASILSTRGAYSDGKGFCQDASLDDDLDLRRAIERNDYTAVKALIEKGASPQNTPNYSPLHWCIQEHNRLGIAKLLIEGGASTTSTGPTGATPLSSAIDRRNLEMVKLLLDNGAEFTMYDNLIPAIETYNLNIVNELVKRGVDVDSSDGRTEFPIMAAIRKQNFDILKLLVENGSNVNVVDGNSNTPLTETIRLREIPMIEYLIKKGADLNKYSSNDSSRWPIMCAICTKSLNILKLLVENGADVNVVDQSGDTPLLNSVRSMNIPAVKYLITKKVDLNAKNAAHETPLSLALSNYDLRTFKLLIEAGADPKLATEAIEAMTKENRDFAAYIKKSKIGN